MSSLLESTTNTRWVKGCGQRYLRSDVPLEITDTQVQWLLDNDVRKVIDLRPAPEADVRPCPLKKDSRFSYFHMPMNTGRLALYADYLDDNFHRIIDEVEFADSSVLFFCDAGKEGTGVIAAFLQFLQGVDEAVIADDYENGDLSLQRNDILDFLAAMKQRLHQNLTTLCYIEQNDSYLMLHRVKKENDLNKDKYIGVGGHFEGNETPDECVLREAREETGLTLTDYRLRGTVTFISDRWPREYMFLYTATGFEGELSDCDEGSLEWIQKSAVGALPLWEGDRAFFELLDTTDDYFLLKLRYEGEKLSECIRA